LTRAELIQEIKNKGSYLCVGLDSDIEKLPRHLLKEKDPQFVFNKRIIDATSDSCVAYKPNLAFYEAQGSRGWEVLEKTLEYIPKNIFTIADAKRGDIGNTANQYAKAFFEKVNFDSVTISPYMGKDAIEPFLAFDNKWAIVLALTSNPGSTDLEEQLLQTGDSLYETVLKKTSKWGTSENTMFVVGATKAEKLQDIRKIIPDHFLLVPGVGSQGGSLAEVTRYGSNTDVGLLVNVSRGIIFASPEKDFDVQARLQARKLQSEMKSYLDNMII